MIFKATINKGKIIYQNASDVSLHLSRLEGKEVSVTIDKYKRSRSKQQLAFRWGILLKRISEETGYSPPELNELFKKMFNAKTITIEKDGNTIVAMEVGTSTETTEDENIYWERIQQFASEQLGIYLPNPSE